MATDDANPPESQAGADGGVTSMESSTMILRKLYANRLAKLPQNRRVAVARVASGVLLDAFCFDPDPTVISGILSNPGFSTKHGRLIAAHHHNGMGIHHLARRSEILRDRRVRMSLIQNAQTPPVVMRRVVQWLPLIELFKLLKGRNMTDQSRRIIREVFRSKYARGGGDEKASLVINTDGRCLPMLIGLPMDGRTAALVCRRSMFSTMFVQNLCRFSGTPPNVLQHLLRQTMVRRNAGLRQRILRHPNCPKSLKLKG